MANSYPFTGAGYVHGIMDGEVMKVFDENILNLTGQQLTPIGGRPQISQPKPRIFR